jgi:GH43 family beta-xylosidase
VATSVLVSSLIQRSSVALEPDVAAFPAEIVAPLLQGSGIRQMAPERAVLINPSGADPWITSDGRLLYYTQTTGRDVRLWVGEDLSSLIDAAPIVLWDPHKDHVINLRNLWAPEIHQIRESWYLYVSADDGHNRNHRMYVLESNEGPAGPYEFKGRLQIPGVDRWAIDGTVTEMKGELYYAWSGWPGPRNGRQDIYLAKMENPWTLTGMVALISQPQYPWESWINEGPQFLHRGNETFIVYSANKSWTDDYKLGLLRLEGEDPLRRSAWRKSPTPIFQSNESALEPVYAPGHCSFHVDAKGEHWLLYHVARSQGSGWSREVRAQRWVWDDDGLPRFGVPLPVQHSSHEDLVTYITPRLHLPAE